VNVADLFFFRLEAGEELDHVRNELPQMLRPFLFFVEVLKGNNDCHAGGIGDFQQGVDGRHGKGRLLWFGLAIIGAIAIVVAASIGFDAFNSNLNFEFRQALLEYGLWKFEDNGKGNSNFELRRLSLSMVCGGMRTTASANLLSAFDCFD